MISSTIELRYVRGDAGAEKIQAVVDEILAELSDPASEAAAAAVAADVRIDEVDRAEVVVTEGSQGLDPILTPIIIGITVSAGSKVAETLWKEVIWPRLRRRLGVAVLKEPQQVDGADGRVP
ncbi:hypothetical protein [Kribbella catacumbae]|uniref:hypothetical protein n=1 Tax=Kribbella catacumbae TaxID=460086 RepID=UPI000371BFD0|nr:hypothetical protein [Kribbella catacumbae]